MGRPKRKLHFLAVGVFNELRNRGMQDCLIACVDGLKGSPEEVERSSPLCLPGCQVPGHRPQLAGGVAAADAVFFNYSPEIRKVIYTPIRSSGGAFPSDDSIVKILYLPIIRMAKKWTMPIRDWRSALNHRYPVRRQGSEVKTGYTVKLTPHLALLAIVLL